MPGIEPNGVALPTISREGAGARMRADDRRLADAAQAATPGETADQGQLTAWPLLTSRNACPGPIDAATIPLMGA